MNIGFVQNFADNFIGKCSFVTESNVVSLALAVIIDRKSRHTAVKIAVIICKNFCSLTVNELAVVNRLNNAAVSKLYGIKLIRT